MKTVKAVLTGLMVMGWAIGLFSFVLFMAWLCGLFFALGSYNGGNPGIGAVAYIPKWIFPLSFLLFLGNTPQLRRLAEKIDAADEQRHPQRMDNFWENRDTDWRE